MHPTDAAYRNLVSGQEVEVRSRVGAIILPLEISEEIMCGVVSIPHGWGHDKEGSKLAIAQQHSGASINDLTDNLVIDTLCGTAAFSGTVATVTAASEADQHYSESTFRKVTA
jgi:anaerobic selenocysteine-containing dehydrogenase